MNVSLYVWMFLVVIFRLVKGRASATLKGGSWLLHFKNQTSLTVNKTLISKLLCRVEHLLFIVAMSLSLLFLMLLNSFIVVHACILTFSVMLLRTVLGAFDKLRKATVNFVISVSPSAWNN